MLKSPYTTRYSLFASVLLLIGLSGMAGPCERIKDAAFFGVVIDSTQQPLAGALVTAHYPSAGGAVTVTTNAEGQYALPKGFDPASEVTAQYPGFQAAHATAETKGNLNFELNQRAQGYVQAPSSAFLSLLPEGEEKRRFILDCTGCHQFDHKIISSGDKPKSHQEWMSRIAQMISFSGGYSSFPIMSPSREADETAFWLKRYIGDPDDGLPEIDPVMPPTPTTEVVITEYDIPLAYDLPHDLIVDAEGKVVITGMMSQRMYVLDPTTGAYSEVPIPVERASPRALEIIDDGSWWVLLGSPQKVAHYVPATETWTDFDIGMYPHSIVYDASGRIWFNGHFTKDPELIGYLDTASGEVTTYEVPNQTMPDGGSTIPYGLRMGPDGTLWATQLVGNRLIKFMPASEQFSLYELPTPYSGPRRPDIAPEGTVWIPEYAANKLARFDPASEAFQEYELPIPDALPYIVRVHPQTQHIWIATAAADAVLRFDPETEQFEVFALPTRSALVRHMDIDAQTGDVWVAYGNSPAVAPKVARIQVL